MRKANVIKNVQEQALASWGNYLVFLRFEKLAEQLAEQDINLENAMAELQQLKEFVFNPKHILGSVLTKHGEIAEQIEVHGENAADLVRGLNPSHSFEGVERLAKEDYLRYGKMVQSKFCQGIDKTFRAVCNHLDTYPDFIADGGTYDIPKDQYETLIDIYHRGETARYTLHKSSWGNEETVFKNIKDWEAKKGVKFDEVVKPARIDYADSQMSIVDKTIKKEEDSVREADKERRNQAQKDTAPTLKEGAKVVAVAAVAEAGVTFCIQVYRKRKAGKKLSSFTSEDWKEVGLDTGKSGIKGGIRGSALYVLSNFTKTPAPIANAVVTATFGILYQANLLREGKINASEFAENSEALCLEVSISSLSAIIGGIVIPVPVLGAVIGNAVGMFMYNISQTYLTSEEQNILKEYLNEILNYRKQLDDEYQAVLKSIEVRIRGFHSVLDIAFDEDVNVRFLGSIAFARYVGADENSIIKNDSDAESIFCSNGPVVLG